MQLKPKISFLLVVSILLMTSFSSFSQKRKKGGKQSENKQITQYERANAEYLLIEAQKFFLLEDYQKSKAFLEQSLDVDNKNHAAFFKLAEIHFILSETEKGIEAITKAISITPSNKYYYLLAAQLHMQKNDFASAATDYEQMIEHTTGYETYLLDLVDVYVILNQPKKAITTIELLESEQGKSTMLTLKKVNLLLESGDSNRAIKSIKELIDSGSDESALVLEYAHLVSSYHSVQEAIDFLESRESTIESRLFLIQLYSGVNQNDKSNALILEAFSNPTIGIDDKIAMINSLLIESDFSENESLLISLISNLKEEYPSNAKTFETAGQLYWNLSSVNSSSKDEFLQKAIDSFIKAKDLDPSDFQVWNRILEVEYNSKNWVNLYEHSNEALDLFPNQGLFYFYHGSAALYIDEPGEANSAFRQATKVASKNIELKSRVMGKIAEMLISQGEIEKGFDKFEEALLLENSHPEVLNNYSLELALRKLNLDKALEISEHLIALDRSSVMYVYTRGFVLFQAGQFAEAEKFMSRIVVEDNFEADGKLLELYGDLLFKINKPIEGLVQWQKAQLIGGGSNKLEQKIATKEYYE